MLHTMGHMYMNFFISLTWVPMAPNLALWVWGGMVFSLWFVFRMKLLISSSSYASHYGTYVKLFNEHIPFSAHSFFVHSKLSTFQFLHIWNWSLSILCTFATSIFCIFHFLHSHYPSVPKVQARLLILMKIFKISQLHTLSVLLMPLRLFGPALLFGSLEYLANSISAHSIFCISCIFQFLHIPFSSHFWIVDILRWQDMHCSKVQPGNDWMAPPMH